MKHYGCFILALFIIFGFSVVQAQSSTEERIQKLEQIIQKQGEKIQDLQKQVTETTTPSREYTEQIVREYLNRPNAAEAPVISTGYESKGFFIRSADSNVEIFFSGFVQVAVGFYESNTYDNNGFFQNGIHVAFDAYFYKQFRGYMEIDLAGGGILDAFVDYTPIPEAGVRVGITHVPFTIAGQYGPTQGIGIYNEPFINNWAHGTRDPGLMLMGTIADMVEYKIGVHNGEGRRGNQSDEMMYAGSLRLYPFKKSENANTYFHLGFVRTRDNSAPHTTGDVNAATLATPWGRTVWAGTPAFVPADPTNPIIGYNNPQRADDWTRGWKTGVDVGFRLDMFLDPAKTMNIRSEIEFMYITWERNTFLSENIGASTNSDRWDKLPDLQGFGFSFGLVFQYNLTPNVEGAGIFPILKFGFADVDNKEANEGNYDSDPFTQFANDPNVYRRSFYNPFGQRIYTYTLGLGYAFNKHVNAQLNWVCVDLDEKDVYDRPTHVSKIGTANTGLTLDQYRQIISERRAAGSGNLEHGFFFQVTAQF